MSIPNKKIDLSILKLVIVIFVLLSSFRVQSSNLNQYFVNQGSNSYVPVSMKLEAVEKLYHTTEALIRSFSNASGEDVVFTDGEFESKLQEQLVKLIAAMQDEELRRHIQTLATSQFDFLRALGLRARSVVRYSIQYEDLANLNSSFQVAATQVSITQNAIFLPEAVNWLVNLMLEQLRSSICLERCVGGKQSAFVSRLLFRLNALTEVFTGDFPAVASNSSVVARIEYYKQEPLAMERQLNNDFSLIMRSFNDDLNEKKVETFRSFFESALKMYMDLSFQERPGAHVLFGLPHSGFADLVKNERESSAQRGFPLFGRPRIFDEWISKISRRYGIYAASDVASSQIVANLKLKMKIIFGSVSDRQWTLYSDQAADALLQKLKNETQKMSCAAIAN